jgi:hypothetical protein
MTTNMDPRLVRLGDALRDAAAADLAAAHAPAVTPPAPTRGRRRRLTRRTGLALVAAAVAIPGAAVAANALLTPDDVARSLPAGTLMLQGTEPSCTVVHDQVEYRCTLARPPQGEIAPGQFKGTVEATVDKSSTVNGGCRSLSADGREWSCYLGQAAVDQEIIGPELLGQHSAGPASG